MLRELYFELHSGWRSIVGDGSMAVLYLIAAAVVVGLFAGCRRKILPALLCVTALIAAAAGLIFEKINALYEGNRRKRAAALVFAGCICMLAIFSSGRSVFSGEFCEKAENDMHIPTGIVSAMSEFAGTGEEITVLAPYEWTPYLEGFSTHLVPLYRNPSLSTADTDMLSEELSKLRPDMRKITAVSKRCGCRFVLLPDGIWPEVPITRCGYELMAEYDGCSVYREVDGP